ncbi:AraC family transcriptional regulator [Nocardia sp. NPDC057353]|uniref:AraC family transcriptional regulator n=1 Tax=Nocardia sp. NPDC057353 TaxID=3346104 RepID=UPI003638855A
MRFASSDLDVVEDFLSRAYARVRFDSAAAADPTTLDRIQLGPGVTLDRLRFGAAMTYAVDPLGTWSVCSVHRGVVEHTGPAGDSVAIGPGRLALLARPDEPATGRLNRTWDDMLSIDPLLLTRVAGSDPGGAPVRLLGHRPLPSGARMLAGVIEQIRLAAAGPDSPLVTQTLATYVATAVAQVFPTDSADERARDRRDARPETVRRAVAFIETNARADLTITEIAAAAFVTPRAVQLAFRTHLGTTPMAYLRRIRLAGAHEQLRRAAADSTESVTSIARDWGFAHPGRFAAAYRQAYGRSPRETMRR